MIALGVADAIVDLVETGSTLAANRLRILDEIGRYQTVMVQNPSGAPARAGRPRGAAAGRGGDRPQLFAAGIQRAAGKLAEAEKITPGFNSPTISALEDPSWCAVRVMVRRGEVIAIMEQLEALGAGAFWKRRSRTAGCSNLSAANPRLLNARPRIEQQLMRVAGLAFR